MEEISDSPGTIVVDFPTLQSQTKQLVTTLNKQLELSELECKRLKEQLQALKHKKNMSSVAIQTEEDQLSAIKNQLEVSELECRRLTEQLQTLQYKKHHLSSEITQTENDTIKLLEETLKNKDFPTLQSQTKQLGERKGSDLQDSSDSKSMKCEPDDAPHLDAQQSGGVSLDHETELKIQEQLKLKKIIDEGSEKDYVWKQYEILKEENTSLSQALYAEKVKVEDFELKPQQISDIIHQQQMPRSSVTTLSKQLEVSELEYKRLKEQLKVLKHKKDTSSVAIQTEEDQLSAIKNQLEVSELECRRLKEQLQTLQYKKHHSSSVNENDNLLDKIKLLEEELKEKESELEMEKKISSCKSREIENLKEGKQLGVKNVEKQSSDREINPLPEKELKTLSDNVFDDITEIDFSQRGLKRHFPDHGVTIIIPKGAVDGLAKLRVGATLLGPFHFPPGTDPVSPIVWVHVDTPLKKKAEVRIPHYVNIRGPQDAKKLHLVTAEDIKYFNKGWLHFEPIETADVYYGESHAVVQMDQFCSLCVTAEDLANLERNYLATLIMPKHLTAKWDLYTYFTFALPKCSEILKKRHPMAEYTKKCRKFTFNSEGVLEIRLSQLQSGWVHEFDYNTTDNVYKVTEHEVDFRTLLPPVTTEEEPEYSQYIDKLRKKLTDEEELELYPPCFHVTIHKKPEATEDLNFKFEISNSVPQTNFHVVAVPGTTAVSNTVDRQLLAISDHSSSTDDSHPKLLSIDDLVDVKQFIRSVIEWKDLGLELGILYSTLTAISRENTESIAACRREMLASWLTKKDNVSRRGGPSWEQLATALRNIDEPTLAENIESRYLNSE